MRRFSLVCLFVGYGTHKRETLLLFTPPDEDTTKVCKNVFIYNSLPHSQSHTSSLLPGSPVMSDIFAKNLGVTHAVSLRRYT